MKKNIVKMIYLNISNYLNEKSDFHTQSQYDQITLEIMRYSYDPHEIRRLYSNNSIYLTDYQRYMIINELFKNFIR